MTDQHPLTDKDLEDLEKSLIGSVMGQLTLPSDFDLARAAADWQLEEVTKKVELKLKEWRIQGYGAGADACEDFFKEVMQDLRPTTKGEQLMTKQITLEEALKLVEFKAGPDGNWQVSTVKGNCDTVEGECGIVKTYCGIVEGDCGTVKGYCDTVRGNCYTVKGDCSIVEGNCFTVKGYCSTVKGNCGTVQGDCGTVVGNCRMVKGYCHTVGGNCVTVKGNCLRVEGEVQGTINGREWQYVKTPREKLQRLIEGTGNRELIDAFNELEDN